ncbi:ABC transporter ATP-binding protein [Dactylosporangium sp. CA-233914]|uniref:ABC transporter ATP-binding protein n=1 Tax=Dactylosporangium sp. CA-233914 TaxID=3239934 RepID=UPI003D8F0980
MGGPWAANGREIRKMSNTGTATAALVVEGLSKTYGANGVDHRAIERVDLEVYAGEFVSIVGPSGSGKTTLLNCVSGLLAPSSGQVRSFGEPIGDGPSAEMAIVFQDYSRSLFPWLTVERNIGLPLKRTGAGKGDVAAAVDSLLESVGLPRSVIGKYPWQLSGGMQQRVAIARALINKPKILLMDEPFASVDAQTRMSLEDLTLRVWKEWNKSILFITHDIDEAIYMSDRVVVLSRGPSTVKATVDVPLPRDRDQIATKQEPLFGKLRSEVMDLVMGQ